MLLKLTIMRFVVVELLQFQYFNLALIIFQETPFPALIFRVEYRLTPSRISLL